MFRGKRKYLFIAALVIILAVGGFLAFEMLGRGKPNFLSVSELKAQGSAAYNQQVMVKGRVEPTSVSWDRASNIITFTLSDSSESVKVVYNGVAPDTFQPGGDLVVAGNYTADGVFRASSLGEKRSGFCKLCH